MLLFCCCLLHVLISPDFIKWAHNHEAFHRLACHYNLWIFLRRLQVLCRIDLRSECIWWLIQGLLDGILSNALKKFVILARVAVTKTRYAIESRGKALAVELETAWVATIASFTVLMLSLVNRDGFGLCWAWFFIACNLISYVWALTER